MLLADKSRATVKTERHQPQKFSRTQPAVCYLRLVGLSGWRQFMDKLLQAVKTYRLTKGLADRLRLAEEIFGYVEPNLRRFLFARVDISPAEDVLQEALKAVASGLPRFNGETVQQFWGFCYVIARNKLRDHLRRKATDRLTPMPPEELWQLVEASAANHPLTPADTSDLKLAMQLLANTRPDCFKLLYDHYIVGLAYAELAEKAESSYDATRVKVYRCVEVARAMMN